jgi:hypothetical protein
MVVDKNDPVMLLYPNNIYRTKRRKRRRKVAPKLMTRVLLMPLPPP